MEIIKHYNTKKIQGEKNNIMNSEQKKILVKAIEQTSPWERIPTSIEGVFVVKTPEHNNIQTIFVELNPSIKGQPIKKRGVYLKNINELEAFQEIINNPKIHELLDTITQYYSRQSVTSIEI